MTNLISLIIPAYKEEMRLAASLETILNYIKKTNLNFEVIVVDDGSKDNTSKVASSFEDIKLIALPYNQGKGAAVREGMLNAKGDLRVFTDADLSTPIYELEKLISSFNLGYDVVIGSRALDTNLIKKHQPFYREYMGKIFNLIVQMLVVRGIKDTQCGFKGFSAKSAIDIFSKTKINGFGFDVEVIYLANKLSYKIKEIPVEWYNDERSKVHPIKDSYRMFKEILKIRNLHS